MRTWIVSWGHDRYRFELATWSEAADYARALMLAGWSGSGIKINAK